MMQSLCVFDEQSRKRFSIGRGLSADKNKDSAHIWWTLRVCGANLKRAVQNNILCGPKKMPRKQHPCNAPPPENAEECEARSGPDYTCKAITRADKLVCRKGANKRKICGHLVLDKMTRADLQAIAMKYYTTTRNDTATKMDYCSIIKDEGKLLSKYKPRYDAYIADQKSSAPSFAKLPQVALPYQKALAVTQAATKKDQSRRGQGQAEKRPPAEQRAMNAVRSFQYAAMKNPRGLQKRKREDDEQDDERPKKQQRGQKAPRRLAEAADCQVASLRYKSKDALFDILETYYNMQPPYQAFSKRELCAYLMNGANLNKPYRDDYNAAHAGAKTDLRFKYLDFSYWPPYKIALVYAYRPLCSQAGFRSYAENTLIDGVKHFYKSPPPGISKRDICTWLANPNNLRDHYREVFQDEIQERPEREKMTLVMPSKPVHKYLYE